MSTRLDENLGAVGFDNLINGVNPPAEVFHVELAGGQGVLERGTLLIKDQGTGAYSIVSEAPNGVQTPAVLAESTDTGTGEAVTAIAYRSGHFNANKLIVGEGYEISETVKDMLRMFNILISDAVEV